MMRDNNVYLTNVSNTKKAKDLNFDVKNQSLTDLVKNNVEVLKYELKGFIKCIVAQIFLFYGIELGPRDVKRDLAENMVTNIILRDEIYVILFKLYS